MLFLFASASTRLPPAPGARAAAASSGRPRGRRTPSNSIGSPDDRRAGGRRLAPMPSGGPGTARARARRLHSVRHHSHRERGRGRRRRAARRRRARQLFHVLLRAADRVRRRRVRRAANRPVISRDDPLMVVWRSQKARDDQLSNLQARARRLVLCSNIRPD